MDKINNNKKMHMFGVAEFMYTEAPKYGLNPEEMYVLGLLHDVGYIFDDWHNHEENGEITFLHKIENGSVDKSYGIHVAKLANLPDSLIKRADEILKTYEKGKTKHEVVSQISMDFEENKKTDKSYDIIKKKLEEINPLEITPIEALNKLYELKKDIENR